MANLKDEIKNISSDVDSLLSIAQRNKTVTEEQLRSIHDFRDDVLSAMETSSNVTAERIDDLKYGLSSLQNDLAKAIGMAGVMFYKVKGDVRADIAYL
jgi:polyhydroxyalkanoate synthesis regulator phasin